MGWVELEFNIRQPEKKSKIYFLFIFFNFFLLLLFFFVITFQVREEVGYFLNTLLLMENLLGGPTVQETKKNVCKKFSISTKISVQCQTGFGVQTIVCNLHTKPLDPVKKMTFLPPQPMNLLICILMILMYLVGTFYSFLLSLYHSR